MPVKRKESIALRNAREELEKATATARRAGALRLPSLRTLAARSGVAVSTMMRAVQHARSTGSLETIPRGGVVLRGSSAECTAGESACVERLTGTSVSVAEMIRRRISGELLDGRYVSGARMPPCKEMARTYDVSVVTMKRALLSLVSEGRLEVGGKRFRVAPLASSTGKIVQLIAPTDWLDAIPHSTHNSSSFWVALEQICRRLTARLSVYGYFVSVPVGYKGQYRNALETYLRGRQKSLLGCIVMGQGDYGAYTHPIVQTTLLLDLPTVVIDQSGLPPPSRVREISGVRRLKWIDVSGGEKSGRDLANALLARGHRRIALFSFSESMVWCRMRVAGIKAAYRDAGCAEGVSVYAIGPSEDRADALASERLRTDVSDAINRVERVFSEIGPSWHVSDQGVFGRIAASADRRVIARAFEPLFARALACDTHSAWVGMNDTVAIIALDYLSSRKVAVPEHVSVAGFDNSAGAFCSGLTSYDFATTATAESTLRFLAGGVYAERSTVTVERIPGEVVIRGTLKDVR